MLRILGLLIVAQTCAAAVAAHEFWIEPRQMLIEAGGSVAPVLKIGEHPQAQTYAFQPRAYAQAVWTGPGAQLDLSRLPLSAPKPALHAFAPGLHSLAVSTYPQKLTYASPEHFERFVREIGREDLLLSTNVDPVFGREVKESYRRYAKTIVHFADRRGKDRRIGLSREWVWQGDTFRLFDGKAPKVAQKARVICSIGPAPQAVTEQELHTNADGNIRPVLPQNGRCLINTVFLEYDDHAGHWTSDWVSLYFMAP
ncbi:hypothetical protein [Sulfitobacter sp. JB4-11]|uniref:hypothetical protein n=1 Tax=Sulfitobacter rhodophyticola TaxID=3238304 RepID=UPI003D81AC0B